LRSIPYLKVQMRTRTDLAGIPQESDHLTFFYLFELRAQIFQVMFIKRIKIKPMLYNYHISFFIGPAGEHYHAITCCLDRRIAALKRHQSQVGDRGAQLEERIRQWTKSMGEKPGYEYAEAFKKLTLY